MHHLLDAVGRLAGAQAAPFVAPVPDARQVQLFSLQDGVPYWFRVRDPRPGWWVCNPQGKEAILEREPAFNDVLEYLEQLPKFRVVCLWPLSSHAWMVMPASFADAKQRGWNGEPRPMHLVREHSLSAFFTITAREMDRTLLFDMPWGYVPLGKRERDVAENLVNAVLEQARQTEKKRAEAERMQDVRERAKFQLEFMGAQLVDWREQDSDYSVTWRDGEHQYTMRVGRNLRIESAGLCLNGTDNQHNLSSIVDVMREAHRVGRPDISGYNNWGDDDD